MLVLKLLSCSSVSAKAVLSVAYLLATQKEGRATYYSCSTVISEPADLRL